jgi:hypothetical protein
MHVVLILTRLMVRYRSVPAFGADKIRKFFSNASEQKKMAARDYANLLQVCHIYFMFLRLIFNQCALPVFDNLLPEPHNSVVNDLLFVLAEWHALAKLRLHTESTVSLLERKTAELAKHVHNFMEVTCQAIHTVETAKEYAARLKRTAKKKKKSVSNAPLQDQNDNPSAPGGASTASPTSESPIKSKLPKALNIQTYKYHSLADYAEHIRCFGTTDSYSTERVRFHKSTFLHHAYILVGRA